MNRPFIITIGRQYGSGGRDIGKQLAQMFGIDYYDKELLLEAARESGLQEDFLEQTDERTPGTLIHALTTAFAGSWGASGENIYKFQSAAIRRLAAKGSCVIVGRTADYILRDNPRCFNFFIHAPQKIRLARIMEREGISEKAARERIAKIDKTRASYYNFYTDKEWGNSASYHMSIDSSMLGTTRSAEFIRDFLKKILNI